MDLYEFSDGQGGITLDEVYQTDEDVIDMAQFVRERASYPDRTGMGAIVVMTQSQRADPATGEKISYAYVMSGKYILDPQTGKYAALDTSPTGNVNPITIGMNWQSPLGKPTFPVVLVARPRGGGVIEKERASATKKLDKTSPTVQGRNDLLRVFGRNPL